MWGWVAQCERRLHEAEQERAQAAKRAELAEREAQRLAKAAEKTDAEAREAAREVAVCECFLLLPFPDTFRVFSAPLPSSAAILHRYCTGATSSPASIPLYPAASALCSILPSASCSSPMPVSAGTPCRAQCRPAGGYQGEERLGGRRAACG